MSPKAERQRQREIDNAAVAGDLITFFLNGGNDAKLSTPKDGVKVVLGAISPLLAEHEYLELVDKAGFKLERTNWGTQRVVEK